MCVEKGVQPRRKAGVPRTRPVNTSVVGWGSCVTTLSVTVFEGLSIQGAAAANQVAQDLFANGYDDLSVRGAKAGSVVVNAMMMACEAYVAEY